MAVAVLADVVFSVEIGKDFLAEETRIHIRDSVVLDAPHRHGTNRTRIDQKIDSDRDLFATGQIVDYVLEPAGRLSRWGNLERAVAFEVVVSVLPDHERRRC